MTELGILTPQSGYTITITQMVGGKPTARVSCLSCVWSEPLTLDVEDAKIAAAITVGVRRWAAHDCPMGAPR